MLPRHPSVHPTPRRPSLCRGIALWSHRCDGKPSPQTPRDGIPSPLPHEPRRPQPRLSQAPHDRAPQTPTPCGIPHEPPAPHTAGHLHLSLHIPRRPYPPRQTAPYILPFPSQTKHPPRPRPANAFAARNPSTQTQPPRATGYLHLSLHEPRRPQSPPLSSTPRPRPANTHAVRNPPRATRRPARRDTFTSPPHIPRPRDKALHISLRPPLMRANAPGL